MKHVYLVAAIIGAIVPYVFFVQHFTEEGFLVASFVSQAFANPVAGGGWADLLISSFVFWLFIFTRGDGAPNPWPFVIINLTIGLSCALPAWLYWQARGAEPATAAG